MAVSSCGTSYWGMSSYHPVLGSTLPVVPDVAPDVVPGVVPGVVPRMVPGEVPDAVPDVVPDVVPEVLPGLVPGASWGALRGASGGASWEASGCASWGASQDAYVEGAHARSAGVLHRELLHGMPDANNQARFQAYWGSKWFWEQRLPFPNHNQKHDHTYYHRL